MYYDILELTNQRSDEYNIFNRQDGTHDEKRQRSDGA